MLQERALASLRTLLPAKQLFIDRATRIAYEVDAGLDKGIPDAVVFPRSVAELQGIVRWAVRHNVPLVARGAGTGLSGGAVADRGGLIVEFVHMKEMLDFDLTGRSAVVEPALINLRLDERAKLHNLYFPPDPSSQRASTIGGNVAENSGGPHCFKYGVTTNYVTGMEVVLADGQHVKLGGHALDYPEYDLCGLVTGSEGTLALITAITVRLLRNPPGVKTLLAVFDSVEQAGVAVSAVIAAGLIPATMEMMDNRIIQIIEPFAKANLPLDAGAVLIIEVDGYPESLDRQMDEIVDILAGAGGSQMRVARDEEERYKLWLARKSAAGAIAREVPAYYTVDITVPRSRLAEILIEVNQICDRYQLRTGHLLHAGDGNLHPMLLIPDPDDHELIERIHAAGHEMVRCCVEKGGSLTGEHGVGIEKREFMSLMHTVDELMAMWNVREVFDPYYLLNPGKIFPPARADEQGFFAGYTQPVPLLEQPISAPPVERVLKPESSQEAAHQLKALAQAGEAVHIGNGRVVGEEKRVLSTERLKGIISYEADDMYITVGAGTPLKEVQAFLAEHGKQVALVSPWEDATVGGLVAANVNGPLRMRYGAVRDNMLCATVALTDGRVIRSGRPIVKNVAGYDLSKVFIGSRGTLGLLTDITLKVTASPRARRTLLVPVSQLAQGIAYGNQLLPLALTASAIILSKGYQGQELSESPYVLAYTAEGLVEDVAAEIEQVRALLRQVHAPEAVEVETLTGTEIWRMQLQEASERAVVVRAGVPVKDLGAYAQGHERTLARHDFIVDFASGFIYAWTDEAESVVVQEWLGVLRQSALAVGGYAVVMDMPERLEEGIDRWGYQPSALSVMKRLQESWDTQHILNPGAFVLS